MDRGEPSGILEDASYKRMCRVLRNQHHGSSYKSSNISSAVLSSYGRRRERGRSSEGERRDEETEDFRVKRASRGWQGTTMTTPPDAHQYPCVECHIFLPIQMTPPLEDQYLPRSPSIIRDPIAPAAPSTFFRPRPHTTEIIPFL